MSNELLTTIADVLKIECSVETSKYPFKIVDSKPEKDLYMVHYDVDEINNSPKDSVERKLRGVIVSEEDGIIVPSFGYTPTIVLDDFDIKTVENVTEKQGQVHNLKEFNTTKILPMFDGTLLRVWKYKNEIHISSHKKIDAINSRWGTSGKFVDLFKKYTEEIFDLEDLFNTEGVEESLEQEYTSIKIHNFLLVDNDLMISSKLSLDNITGFVLYINSVNCTLPSNIEDNLSTLHYTEIKCTDKTVFKVKSFDMNETEYQSFLTKGFFPNETDINPQISLGEGLILFNGINMLKIVSNGYNNRSKLVNNDPNILHRVFELLTDSQYPKEGTDNFLEKYSIVSIPNDEQIKSMKEPLVSKFPEDWKIPTAEELTSTSVKESYDNRLRTVITHYAMTLPLYHQKPAFTAIRELLDERFKATQIICNNYDRYSKKQYGEDVTPRDLKVYERIHKMVTDAKNYANVRIKRGEKLNGASEGQTFNKFVKDNIRGLMLREYGTSLYKIVRVLIHSSKDE
jgi:hypothetical protein